MTGKSLQSTSGSQNFKLRFPLAPLTPRSPPRFAASAADYILILSILVLSITFEVKSYLLKGEKRHHGDKSSPSPGYEWALTLPTFDVSTHI